MLKNTSTRTLAAYAAGIFVIAGLFSIVALGGNAVSSKKAAYFGPPQIQVSK